MTFILPFMLYYAVCCVSIYPLNIQYNHTLTRKQLKVEFLLGSASTKMRSPKCGRSLELTVDYGNKAYVLSVRIFTLHLM